MNTAPVPHAALRRLEKLSHWLDDAIRIPGTRFRIGLESLIGLIPGIGDIAGLIMGGYVVVEAHRMGAPGELKLRMIRNVAIDALAGVIPVFGDLYDFAYRSNRRNLKMLFEHYQPKSAPLPRTRPFGRLALILLLGLAVAGGWWFWKHF